MTRVAAVDCGTNSIRLLVADVPPEGPHADLLRRTMPRRCQASADCCSRASRAAPLPRV